MFEFHINYHLFAMFDHFAICPYLPLSPLCYVVHTTFLSKVLIYLALPVLLFLPASHA